MIAKASSSRPTSCSTRALARGRTRRTAAAALLLEEGVGLCDLLVDRIVVEVVRLGASGLSGHVMPLGLVVRELVPYEVYGPALQRARAGAEERRVAVLTRANSACSL